MCSGGTSPRLTGRACEAVTFCPDAEARAPSLGAPLWTPADSGKRGSSGQGPHGPPASWHQGEEGDGGGRVT